MYYFSFFAKVFLLMLFTVLFVVTIALGTVVYDGFK